MDIQKVDEVAKRLIKNAGKMLRESLTDQLDIIEKADKDDLVTNMDKKVETYFIDNIQQAFPEHRILGEEGMGEAVTDKKGVIWILDPIDGTMNFIVKKRDFAISLGIFEEGVGKLGYVYDVMRGQLYTAEKDQGAQMNGKEMAQVDQNLSLESSLLLAGISEVLDDYPKLYQAIKKSHGMRFHGCAAIEMMEVGSGRAGSFPHKELKPWDVAGSIIILKELGAKVTRLDGTQVDVFEKGSILASAPKVHDELLEQYI